MKILILYLLFVAVIHNLDFWEVNFHLLLNAFEMFGVFEFFKF